MTSAVLTKKTGAHRAAARPETLTEQAYNRLEEMIVTLTLAPGAVLVRAGAVDRSRHRPHADSRSPAAAGA